MPYLHQVPAAHHCEPPDPMGGPDAWDHDGEGPPRLRPGVRLPRVGDVWQCDDCGLTWRLRPPLREVGGISFVKVWRPEGHIARWWRKLRKEAR